MLGAHELPGALKCRVSIADVHIAGVEMVACGVDVLSRPPTPGALSEAIRAEWQVLPWLWEHVNATLAARIPDFAFTCDRFASRANALLPRLCSLRRELGALMPPNAFAHGWVGLAGEINWASRPPTQVICGF